MNIGLSAPAARATLRSLMRKRAGRMPCMTSRPYFCGRISDPDFGADRALSERQWIDSFTASSCPCCSSRPSFSSGTCWGRA